MKKILSLSVSLILIFIWDGRAASQSSLDDSGFSKDRRTLRTPLEDNSDSVVDRMILDDSGISSENKTPSKQCQQKSIVQTPSLSLYERRRKIKNTPLVLSCVCIKAPNSFQDKDVVMPSIVMQSRDFDLQSQADSHRKDVSENLIFVQGSSKEQKEWVRSDSRRELMNKLTSIPLARKTNV